MDARRRCWLEKVVVACDRVPERDRQTTDAHRRHLFVDVRALRAGLVAQLDRDAAPPPAAGP